MCSHAPPMPLLHAQEDGVVACSRKAAVTVPGAEPPTQPASDPLALPTTMKRAILMPGRGETKRQVGGADVRRYCRNGG
jgi:hypothetical protein